MKTTAEKKRKTPVKPVKDTVAKPSKIKEGYGILKGKIHCDDSVFNLGL